jgi:hypothetical protein
VSALSERADEAPESRILAATTYASLSGRAS